MPRTPALRSEPREAGQGIKCGIHSNAITETGPSRSPKPVHRDHRNRFIAIGGPANLAVII
jgi:hypothetical protein